MSYGVIDAPIVVLRGTVDFAAGANLSIPAGLLIFNSPGITASGDGARLQLGQAAGSTLSVTGGLNSVNMGAGSQFDLDGTGDKVVNIAAGSSLSLAVESIDLGGSPSFDGILNIDGALHIEAVNGVNTWESTAEIDLDDGEITGQRLVNNGILRGHGSAAANTTNNGEIIADGGTLQFGFVSMDGDQAPAAGILRAQTGDLVMNMQSNGATHNFTGSLFVGNGSGIREVFNANVNLCLYEENGATGFMHLNSGFVVLNDFQSYGEMTLQGTSLICTTGLNDAHRISFSSQSVDTVVGTLKVDGRTWFVPGAQFIGEGTIQAVSTVKGTYFQEDSDLSDVRFKSAGVVNIWSFFQDAQATMGSLTLGPSADLHIQMSDITDTISTEKFIVHDEAHLDGTLTLIWAGNGPAPTGEAVTVPQAGSIVGSFDEIDDSGLGFNCRAYVTINSDSVRVFVTCAADLNADGVANLFDVSVFLAQFNGMDPAADLNGDGLLNFFDITILLDALQESC